VSRLVTVPTDPFTRPTAHFCLNGRSADPETPKMASFLVTIPVGVTTSHQCCGSCIGCQSVSACCLRLRGLYINHLLERLLCTRLTTAVSCRTLVVGHCGLTRMTFGSNSCQERITNSVIGVSRPPVPDYGTTFHLDYGDRDLPLTLLKSL